MQHGHSKGVSSLISTVLYISLAAGAVVTVFLLAEPITQNLSDANVIDSMVTSMTTIEDTIRTVANAGKGTQQPLNLGFQSGSLEIDAAQDTIEFSIQTASNLIAAGTSQRYGNVRLSSGNSIDIKQTTQEGTDCWLITSEHIETCIKDIPETPDSLLLYQQYNGNKQTVYDSGAYNNSGTRGSTTAPEESDPRRIDSCAAGTCLAFDGDDDTVTTDWNTSLGMQTNMTISTWLLRDNDPSPHISKQNTTHTSFLTYVDASGTWQYENTNGAVTADQQIDEGTWTHLTVTKNTSHVSFYINGQHDSSKQLSETSHVPAGVTIGTDTDGTYGTGRLDDLAVYNTTLKSNEINHRFNAGIYGESFYTTNDLLVSYTNTHTNLSVTDPAIEAHINGKVSNRKGFGSTRINDVGPTRPRGTVTATMKTIDGLSYDLILTVVSGADFIHARLKPS